MEPSATLQSFEEQMEIWQIPIYQRPYYKNWLNAYLKFYRTAGIDPSNLSQKDVYIENVSKSKSARRKNTSLLKGVMRKAFFIAFMLYEFSISFLR